MNAGADVVRLTRHPEPSVAAARGNEHRLGAVGAVVAGLDAMVVAVTAEMLRFLGLQQFHPKAFGLPPQAVARRAWPLLRPKRLLLL